MEVILSLFYNFCYKCEAIRTYCTGIFGSQKCKNRLSRCWNPSAERLEMSLQFTCGLKSFATQAFGVPIIVKSLLTSGFFFQKIAFAHRTNLMVLVGGLLNWKVARINTYKDDINLPGLKENFHGFAHVRSRMTVIVL